MCTFVTAMIPKNAVTPELRRLFSEHSFGWHEMHNSSLSLLLPDSIQLLPLGDQCNCSTALGAADQKDPRGIDDIDAEIAKLREKGWSDAKIQRWHLDKERAATRRKEHLHHGVKNELQTWVNLIRDLLSRMLIPRFALILHFYDGPLDDEKISVSATRRIPLAELSANALAHLERDVLYKFARA
jgi:hypothetical protein